jgi:hypothetical protein
MSTSKSIATIFTVFVCATALTIDASAQGRGGGGHGGASGGGRAPAAGRPAPQGGGPQMSVPRGGGNVNGAPYHGGGPYPVYGNGRYPYYGYGRYPYYGYGRYPYYGYPYYGYGYGYPYYGYPGFSLGFSWGYGYPGYPAYAAPYAPYGYVVPGAAATYGGIRISGAPENAEVYLDGSYAGTVDDYNGTFERLDLEPGSHEIEIRGGPSPLKYDVNVNPGQTVTLHAKVK